MYPDSVGSAGAGGLQVCSSHVAILIAHGDRGIVLQAEHFKTGTEANDLTLFAVEAADHPDPTKSGLWTLPIFAWKVKGRGGT